MFLNCRASPPFKAAAKYKAIRTGEAGGTLSWDDEDHR
jgi:hypothetical protein